MPPSIGSASIARPKIRSGAIACPFLICMTQSILWIFILRFALLTVGRFCSAQKSRDVIRAEGPPFIQRRAKPWYIGRTACYILLCLAVFGPTGQEFAWRLTNGMRGIEDELFARWPTLLETKNDFDTAVVPGLRPSLGKLTPLRGSHLPQRSRNRNGLHELSHRKLNCGLRVPPSAGSASGVLPNPVGYNRAYVYVGRDMTYDRWCQGLKAGRSFVTNGPLLLVRANEQLPGHVFTASEGAKVVIRLQAGACQPGPCSGSGSRERRSRDRDGFTRTACFKPSGQHHLRSQRLVSGSGG